MPSFESVQRFSPEKVPGLFLFCDFFKIFCQFFDKKQKNQLLGRKNRWLKLAKKDNGYIC